MFSAKHDRKYSCAYCSVPPDTAHRRQHSREKIQMMLFAAKSLKNRQGQARVCSTCKRHCSKFVERCAGRKADWASFFLPKYTALGFSKEKKLFLSSSSPPFILQLCFVSYRASTSRDVLPKWITGPFLSYQLQLCSSLSSSSLQFLLTALQRDDITWTSRFALRKIIFTSFVWLLKNLQTKGHRGRIEVAITGGAVSCER